MGRGGKKRKASSVFQAASFQAGPNFSLLYEDEDLFWEEMSSLSSYQKTNVLSSTLPMRYAAYVLEQTRLEAESTSSWHWYNDRDEDFDDEAADEIKRQFIEKVKDPSLPRPGIEDAALRRYRQGYLIYYMEKAKKLFEEDPEKALEWFIHDLPLFVEKIPPPTRASIMGLGNPPIDRAYLVHKVARGATYQLLLSSLAVRETNRERENIEAVLGIRLEDMWVSAFLYETLKKDLAEKILSGEVIDRECTEAKAAAFAQIIIMAITQEEKYELRKFVSKEGPDPSESMKKIEKLFSKELYEESLQVAENIDQKSFADHLQKASLKYIRENRKTSFAEIFHAELTRG